jgi:hypothetical protein
MNFGDYRLSYLPNCNGEDRMKKWTSEGGTLDNDKSIGCGINSLTFLGIFSRKDGERYVREVLDKSRGTSFIEMMQLVSTFNKNKIAYQEIIFYVHTDDLITKFLDNVTLLLPDNSCTVAKLTRDKDPRIRPPQCRRFTEGHSLVFSKENGVLYTIDPQQMTIRKRNNPKIIESWKANCYISVSLIFQHKSHDTPIQPVRRADFSQLINVSPPILVDLNENSIQNESIQRTSDSGSPMSVVSESSRRSARGTSRRSVRSSSRRSVRSSSRRSVRSSSRRSVRSSSRRSVRSSSRRSVRSSSRSPGSPMSIT